MKKCTKCGEQKPFESYKRDSSKKDGLYSSCKDCVKADWKRKYPEIAEKHRSRVKSYIKQNKESYEAYQRAYHADKQNREKAKERTKQWAKQNASLKKANSMLWKKRVRRSTPSWVDSKEIAKLYDEAIQMKNQSGIDFHVDHIVPIKHDLVCGLNVPWNLQVISSKENLAKSNKFEVD